MGTPQYHVTMTYRSTLTARSATEAMLMAQKQIIERKVTAEVTTQEVGSNSPPSTTTLLPDSFEYISRQTIHETMGHTGDCWCCCEEGCGG